jgi:bacterioferritin
MKKESIKDNIQQATKSEIKFNVAEIRSKAREHLSDGAVTDNYASNREVVINLLQTALATEWTCVLRYTQHQISAEGIHAEPVARHFAEHATEEQSLGFSAPTAPS